MVEIVDIVGGGCLLIRGWHYLVGWEANVSFWHLRFDSFSSRTLQVNFSKMHTPKLKMELLEQICAAICVFLHAVDFLQGWIVPTSSGLASTNFTHQKWRPLSSNNVLTRKILAVKVRAGGRCKISVPRHLSQHHGVPDPPLTKQCLIWSAEAFRERRCWFVLLATVDFKPAPLNLWMPADRPAWCPSDC